MINYTLESFIHHFTTGQACTMLPEELGALRKQLTAFVEESDLAELATLLHVFPTTEAVTSTLQRMIGDAEAEAY